MSVYTYAFVIVRERATLKIDRRSLRTNTTLEDIFISKLLAYLERGDIALSSDIYGMPEQNVWILLLKVESSVIYSEYTMQKWISKDKV